AAVGRLVEGCSLPQEIVVSYEATFPEIKVQLTSEGFRLDQCIDTVRSAIGEEHIISEGPTRTSHLPSIEEALHELFIAKKLTVATAESCTGGMIGERLTRTPGSSQYFLGGVVSYSNEAKSTFLGVPPELIQSHGAVSAPVAEAMASGAKERFGSDYAVSVTGIAGPDGGSKEKPV